MLSSIQVVPEKPVRLVTEPLKSLGQIMISYRRNETGPIEYGGDNTAAQLAEGLKLAGYTVFLDVEELTVGVCGQSDN